MNVENMGVLLRDTVGALLIGVLFAIFFQGILTVQSYVYYMRFPFDPLRTRILVGVLWLLDFTHLVLISDALYSYAVTNWGNVDALHYSTRTLDAHLIPLSLATILCQAFFLHRICLFSKRNILVIPLALACLSTFGLAITGTVQSSANLSNVSFQNKINRNVIIALFSTGAATDVAIAVTMCWYLYQGRNGTTLSRTASTLTRLIYQVGATGLATGMIAVAALVAYTIRPDSLIFISIHFSLGRMYTNSLLVSLNARVNLQKDDHVVFPPNGILVSVTRSTQVRDFDTSAPVSTTAVRPLVGSHLEEHGQVVLWGGGEKSQDFVPAY